MLTPIPGLAHLQIFVPEEPPAVASSDVLDIDLAHRIAPLIQIALEVISGIRPARHARSRQFGSAVRIHINSRLRSGATVTGPVTVASMHSQPSSTQPGYHEVFGTATIGESTRCSRHGFTAVCSSEVLISLRLLSA